MDTRFIIPLLATAIASGQTMQAPWSISGKNSVVVSVTTGADTAQASVPVLGAQPGIFILDAASSGATHTDGSIAGASNRQRAAKRWSST